MLRLHVSLRRAAVNSLETPRGFQFSGSFSCRRSRGKMRTRSKIQRKTRAESSVEAVLRFFIPGAGFERFLGIGRSAGRLGFKTN